MFKISRLAVVALGMLLPFLQAGATDIAVHKLANGSTFLVGENVTYTIQYDNANQISAIYDAVGAYVEDTLPAGLTFVSATATQGSCLYSAADRKITCDLGTVTVGSTASITVVVRADAAGPIENCAFGAHGDFDPDEENNEGCATITVTEPQADLQIVKSYAGITGTTLAIGASVAWTMTVSNDGPDAASQVVLEDVFPDGFAYGSHTPGSANCVVLGSPDRLRCTWPQIPVGGSEQVGLSGTVTGSTSQVVNTGRVSAASSDPNSFNNSSFSLVNVKKAAELTLAKVVQPETAFLDEIVTYTLTATATSPENLVVPITITDRIPAGLQVLDATWPSGSCSVSAQTVTCTGNLASGGSAIITIRAIVVEGVAVGSVVNNAAATLPESWENTYEREAKATAAVEVPAHADLVTAVEGPTGPIGFGDRATYTIIGRNRGPGTVAPATLIAYIPEALHDAEANFVDFPCAVTVVAVTCTIPTLGPGSEAYFTVSGRWMPGVSSDPRPEFRSEILDPPSFPDPYPLNNRAEWAADFSPFVDMGITKQPVDGVLAFVDGNGNSIGTYAGVGSTVTYLLVARAASDLGFPATNVVITDPLPAGLRFVDATTATGSCEYIVDDHLVVCRIPSMAPGSQAEIRIRAVVEASAAEQFVNRAQVSADEVDPNPENDEATSEIRLLRSYDIAASINAPPIFTPGQSSATTATFDNKGVAVAPAYHLTFAWLGGFNDQRVTVSAALDGKCTLSATVEGGEVRCTVPQIASHEAFQIQLVGTPVLSHATLYSFLASVEPVTPGSGDDTDPTNDRAELEVSSSGMIGMSRFAYVPPEGPGKTESTAAVDLYLDDILVADDLAPGVATTFLSVSYLRTTPILYVVDGSATDNASPLATLDLSDFFGGTDPVVPPEYLQVLLLGDGSNLAIAATADLPAASPDPGSAILNLIHQASGVGEVRLDVLDAAGGTLGSLPTFGHGSFAAVPSLAAASVTLLVGAAAGSQELGRFAVDLSMNAGQAVTAVLLDGPNGSVRLFTVYPDGSTVLPPSSTAGEPADELPVGQRLSGMYPNPFRDEAVIGYDVGTPGPVSIEVMDLLGRTVRTLASGVHVAGSHRVTWDGTLATGETARSGVYLVRIVSPSGRDAAPLVLVR